MELILYFIFFQDEVVFFVCLVFFLFLFLVFVFFVLFFFFLGHKSRDSKVKKKVTSSPRFFSHKHFKPAAVLGENKNMKTNHGDFFRKD